jgi:hypothetical protein
MKTFIQYLHLPRKLRGLTTVLQRNNQSSLLSYKGYLCPLNTTVRPLGYMSGRNRNVIGGVRSLSMQNFSKARKFTAIFPVSHEQALYLLPSSN